MPLTSPALTISVLVPTTCACRVSSFRGACDKIRTREAARKSLRLESLGTVIFAQFAYLRRTLPFHTRWAYF